MPKLRALAVALVAVAVLVAGCASGTVAGTGTAAHPTHSGPTGFPSSDPPKPVKYPRTPHPINGLGDPATMDICAMISGRIHVGSLQVVPIPAQYPPGCSVRMTSGSTIVFRLGGYLQSDAYDLPTPATTKSVSGFVVSASAFNTTTKDCARVVDLRGAYLQIHTYASEPSATQQELCSAADQYAAAVALAAGGGDVPRVRLASPSLSGFDLCAVLRVAGTKPFTGTAVNDSFGLHCTVTTTSSTGNDLYLDFALAKPGPPTDSVPTTLGGRRVYVNKQDGCVVTYLGGTTPAGMQEQLSLEVYPNGPPPTDLTPLCTDTEAVTGRVLDAAGLK